MRLPKCLVEWREKWLIKHKGQHTFIYCDCGRELVSSKSLVHNNKKSGRDNLVIYKCVDCGKVSTYNFDLAPSPLKVEVCKCRRCEEVLTEHSSKMWIGMMSGYVYLQCHKCKEDTKVANDLFEWNTQKGYRYFKPIGSKN